MEVVVLCYLRPPIGRLVHCGHAPKTCYAHAQPCSYTRPILYLGPCVRFPGVEAGLSNGDNDLDALLCPTPPVTDGPLHITDCVLVGRRFTSTVYIIINFFLYIATTSLFLINQ